MIDYRSVAGSLKLKDKRNILWTTGHAPRTILIYIYVFNHLT